MPLQSLPPIPEEQISQELFESRLEPIEHLSQPLSTPQGSQIFNEAILKALLVSLSRETVQKLFQVK